jgi:hypothetical protein
MNREQRRAAADDVIGFKVDGVTYPLRMSDVSSTMELDLHRATGLTIVEIGEALEAGRPAVFHVAALVWLSRRTHGDSVSFQTVADAITYGSEVEAIAGSGDAPPEAPAAD